MEFCLRPLGLMKFLQNNNNQAVNKMKGIEKYSQEPSGLSRTLYLCVCVCVCVCVGYSCALLCVYVWVVYSACVWEGTCAARCFYRMLVVDVSDIATVLSRKILYLFLYV